MVWVPRKTRRENPSLRYSVWGITRLLRAIAWLLSVVVPVMSRVQVEGLEHIPKRGPALIYFNHPSFREPHKLFTAVRHRNMTILAMDELFRYFALGWLLRFMGIIPVLRDSSFAKLAADRLVAVLKAGGVGALAPEGKRTKPGELLSDFKGGLAYAAQACPNVPVIPAAILGTLGRRPKGWRGLFYKPPVCVVFGPPLRGIASHPGDMRQRRESFTISAQDALTDMLRTRGYAGRPLR
jgi:1-acyl-sn-glycerol-3-phosphate acyltransferase